MNTDRVVIVYIILASLVSLWLFPFLISKVVGYDTLYHLLMVKDIIRNKTLFPHHPLICMPYEFSSWYPPFFHWFIAAFSLSNLQNVGYILRALQVLLFPACLYVIYLLYKNFGDKGDALLGVIILSFTFPFFMRTHLPYPEVFEHLLIALTLMACLKGREKICGVLLLIQFFNHLITPFTLLFLIIAYWMYKKEKKSKIATMVLIAVPGIIFQLMALPVYNDVLNATYSYKEGQYHLLESSYASSALSIIIILLLGALELWHNRRNINLLHFWVLILIPTFIYAPARFITYAAVPLSLLTAAYVRRKSNACCKTNLDKVVNAAIVLTVLILVHGMLLSINFYVHSYDLVTADTRSNEAETQVMEWLVKNTNADDVIITWDTYDAYSILYYTERRVSNYKSNYNQSKYLYEVVGLNNSTSYCLYNRSGPPDNKWILIREWTFNLSKYDSHNKLDDGDVRVG